MNRLYFASPSIDACGVLLAIHVLRKEQLLICTLSLLSFKQFTDTTTSAGSTASLMVFGKGMCQMPFRISSMLY